MTADTGRRLRVMVLDDDVDELERTRDVLGDDYDVYTVTDVRTGLAYAQEELPDAIILDVMMPNSTDGFTLFMKLKNDNRTRDIPVLFVSSVNAVTGLPFTREELGRYLGHQPAAFLEKPVLPSTLRRQLAEACNEHIREV